MKRRSKKEPMAVTSFRLPAEVKAFLKKKAQDADRSISYILVEYVRRWIEYEAVQAKQPKISK